jgi:hypothetical protein
MKTPNENHRRRHMLTAAVMKRFAISLVFLATVAGPALLTA